MPKKNLLNAAIALFLLLLVLSWFFHGQGVVHNDPKHHLYIPPTLTMPLQVKVAYNGDKIFFRYRWYTDKPVLFHDLAKFEGGKWVRKFGDGTGANPEDRIEDRVTMMVDDGSVPEFEKYGGYITIGDRMRFFANAAGKDQVKKHPYLGGQLKKSDVRKYLPETRTNLNDWASVVPEATLKAQRAAGYFLDLWHWRAHRSNPIGVSDDEQIFEFRRGDAGDGPFTSNWDADKGQPRFMLDPKKVGRTALAWNDIQQGKLGFDDVYYISQDIAVPFDPKLAWKDGDVLPRLLLRKPSGSHGDIAVAGKARWKDGYWDVTLVRKMDTGNPLDDKAFVDHRSYALAFAVHRKAAEGRWHYVSLPKRLGLSHNADFQAVRFTGDTPKWDQPWYDVTLFYPGQVSWPLLNSAKHAGAENIKKGTPVRVRHSEIQLAHYGIEMEFYDAIRKQWMYTLIAGVLLIIGFGIALNLLLGRKEN